jgi:hypothetical protein
LFQTFGDGFDEYFQKTKLGAFIGTIQGRGIDTNNRDVSLGYDRGGPFRICNKPHFAETAALLKGVYALSLFFYIHDTGENDVKGVINLTFFNNRFTGFV